MTSPLVFVHLRKTAGTTMLNVLRREYGEDGVIEVHSSIGNLERSLALTRASLLEGSKPRVISGHFGGNTARFLETDGPVITVLREPMDRFLSQYYFFRGRNERSPYRNLSLEDLLRGSELPKWNLSSPADAVHLFDNTMTRFLASPHAFPIEVPFGQVSSAMLTAAITNLRSMTAIGLMERFEESLDIFGRRLGWRNVQAPYGHDNQTEERIQVNDLSPETRDLLRRWNELDLILYDYAKVLFREQLVA